MSWDRSKGRPEPIRALNRVTEQENHEPMVDMREACPAVKVLRPTCIPYCRETVAKMAQKAAESLPDGVFLSVGEAWRPLKRQQMIYDFMSGSYLEVFPEASKATVRRVANRWVAPTDQKAPPGHCTGAALDVFLLDSSDELLDVISPLPRFKANPTYVFGLSEVALQNRMMLVEAMLGAGFSNCRDEWWHYSYGDAGWAVRMGLDTCFYGLVELPEEYYTIEQELWEANLNDRPNPFKN